MDAQIIAANKIETKNTLYKILNFVERVGNAVPNPAILFVALTFLVVIASAIVTNADITVQHPTTKETIRAVNLLSVEGLHRVLTGLVTNFTSFAPLGTVLVALLGIAVAEASGLIRTSLRLLVMSSPKKLLTVVVVFAGVLSHTASDIGYVLLIPLSAMIFLAVGRHPLAGLAAAFAGVSGGFSANLLLGPIDAMLAGITQEAAHIVDPAYSVTPVANYYFMASSAILVTVLGTWITEKLVVPRLGEYKGDAVPEKLETLTDAEKRGMKFAFAALLIFVGIILLGTIPADGFLRDTKTGELLKSPFLSGIVAVIFAGGVFLGLAFGIGARTVKSTNDVTNAMENSMKTMSTYLVLAFFAAQFIALFNWSNLGVIIAVNGAEFLKNLEVSGVTLIITFIVATMILDLLIGSAAAKWALVAPIFVPMMMILGYSPEMTQATYRIGDSVINIVSPLMSYFPLIVAFAQKYDGRAGIGTLMALMMPYSVAFFVGWTLFLVIWFYLGLPLGPGAELFYQMPAPQ
ncbi:MAG: AbgT family transporter [Pyrinomonadaceae bacterium]|nr:AbgT family transporter [Pyrinomonadaceae bacterium]